MIPPPYEKSPALAALPGIKHGFFGRRCGTVANGPGDLNVSDTIGDNPDRAADNRRTAMTALGLSSATLIRLKQIHSNGVVRVEEAFDPASLPQADGAVTSLPGRALSIVTADCVPILLADPEAGVIGACHAGREGALTCIVENTLAEMAALGAEPARIVAAVGPSISSENYEIGHELAKTLAARDPLTGDYIATSARQQEHFDLPGYVVARLGKCGLAAIDRIGGCTYAAPLRYFSHRHFTHTGRGAGRQISIIGLT
jgi:hypothetical protein